MSPKTLTRRAVERRSGPPRSARYVSLTARLVGMSSTLKALSEFAECIDQVAQ